MPAPVGRWSTQEVVMHSFLRRVAVRFPELLLRLLHRRVPLYRDSADGWTLWLDASYARWVKRDRARVADTFDEQSL